MLVASVAAAAAFVHFVSRAYAVESIVTWDNPIAPFTQWACAIAAGAMVALAGLRAAHFPVGRRLAAALIAASALAAVVCACLLAAELQIVSDMRTVTTNAADMAPLLTMQIGAFVVLAAAGIVCTCVNERRSGISGEGRVEGEAESARKTNAEAPAGARSSRVGRRVAAASVNAGAKPSLRTLAPPIAATILLLAACFIVRFAFYAMYMTAGI